MLTIEIDTHLTFSFFPPYLATNASVQSSYKSMANFSVIAKDEVSGKVLIFGFAFVFIYIDIV